MMPAQKPISKSSMSIEIILPEDPVVVRGHEDSSPPRRNKSNLVLLCCGLAVLILLFVYFGYRKTVKPAATGPATSEQINITNTGPLSSEDAVVAKKRIFSQGVRNAKLVFETIDGRNCLKIVAQDLKNVPGIAWVFEWTKNGQLFGQGDAVSGFRRGEVLTVKITPYDGETRGTSKVLRTEIKNTAPEVAVEKGTIIEGENLSYQVKAVDPDGDPLLYSLVDAPKGMSIDPKTGVITLAGQPQDQGSYSVKVKVTDDQGGESIYPLNIDPIKPTIK